MSTAKYFIFIVYYIFVSFRIETLNAVSMILKEDKKELELFVYLWF